MKHSTEFEAFDALVRQVMSVPRAKLVEREEEYRFHSALNPSRPGPKPGTKRKKRVSPAPADQPPS